MVGRAGVRLPLPPPPHPPDRDPRPMNANRPQTRPRRRGYTLIEMAIAVIVVMTAMGVTVRVLGWNARERRAADRREWAVQAASNILERVSAEPFDRVTA